jgi:CrcB protein
MILALVVAGAGGVGALARFLADGAVQDRTSGPFPYGTLAVNVAGSFVLGVITGAVWYHGVGGKLDAVGGAGFCGGLTTWSSASWESVRLVESGHLRHAAVYTLGGLVVALAAAVAGIALVGAL